MRRWMVGGLVLALILSGLSPGLLAEEETTVDPRLVWDRGAGPVLQAEQLLPVEEGVLRVSETTLQLTTRDEVRWTTTLPGSTVFADLTLHDGRIHVPGRDAAYTLDMATGVVLDRVPVDLGAVYGIERTEDAMAIHGGGFVVDGDGELLWEAPGHTRVAGLERPGDAQGAFAMISAPSFPTPEATVRVVEPDGTLLWEKTVSSTFLEGQQGTICTQAAEFDGDAGDELLLTFGTLAAVALDSDGRLLWEARGTDQSPYAQCAAGDLTGDGLDDAVVSTIITTGQGHGEVMAFDGASGLNRWSMETEGGLPVLTTTDLDGDGREDVLGRTITPLPFGYPVVPISWQAGPREDHITAFRGDAVGVGEILWTRSLLDQGGVAGNHGGLAATGPQDDVLAWDPYKGALLHLDPATGATLDRVPGYTAPATGDLPTGWTGDAGGQLWELGASSPFAQVEGQVRAITPTPHGTVVSHATGVALFEAATPTWETELPGGAGPTTWTTPNLLVAEDPIVASAARSAKLHQVTPDGEQAATLILQGARIQAMVNIGDVNGNGVDDVVLGMTSGPSKLVDGGTLDVLADLAGPTDVETIVPTPHGLASIGEAGLALVDPTSNTATWIEEGTVYDAAWHQEAIVYGTFDGATRLVTWDPTTKSEQDRRSLPAFPLILTPIAAGLLIGSNEGTLLVQDNTVIGPTAGPEPTTCRDSVCLGPGRAGQTAEPILDRAPPSVDLAITNAPHGGLTVQISGTDDTAIAATTLQREGDTIAKAPGPSLEVDLPREPVELTAMVHDLAGRTASATEQADPTNHAPVARIEGGPVSGSVQSPITFTSTSTDPDGQNLEHRWDLGDGTSATGTTVEHRYAAPGTYEVTLTVEDPEGRTDTATTSATIENLAPILRSLRVDTAGPGDPVEGESIVVTLGLEDKEGDLSKLTRPGQAAIDLAPWQDVVSFERTFPDPGTYLIELTMETTAGPDRQLELPVTVRENQPPEVTLRSLDLANAGESTQLTADATDPEQRPLSLSWTVSGDPTPSTWTPPAPGIYDVQVHAEDPSGAVATATGEVTVDDAIALSTELMRTGNGPTDSIHLAGTVTRVGEDPTPAAQVQITVEGPLGERTLETEQEGAFLIELPADVGDLWLPGDHSVHVAAEAPSSPAGQPGEEIDRAVEHFRITLAT